MSTKGAKTKEPAGFGETPPSVSHLRDVLTVAKWLESKGTSQKDLFEWLDKFLSRLGIVMRFQTAKALMQSEHDEHNEHGERDVRGEHGEHGEHGGHGERAQREVGEPDTPSNNQAVRDSHESRFSDIEDESDSDVASDVASDVTSESASEVSELSDSTADSTAESATSELSDSTTGPRSHNKRKTKWVPLDFVIYKGKLHVSDPNPRTRPLFPPLPSPINKSRPKKRKGGRTTGTDTPVKIAKRPDRENANDAHDAHGARDAQGEQAEQAAQDVQITDRFDFLEDGNDPITLIQLSVTPSCVSLKHKDMPIIAESNGAVIDAKEWKALSIPSQAFARNVARSDRPKVGNYDIVVVEDGTIVNIYPWDHPEKGPLWSIASVNGYDISNFRWMGNKTYAEIIYELVSEYDEEICELKRGVLRPNDYRLDFNLDRRYNYTIGFRHHDFHPFIYDPQKVWYVQQTNLETFETTYEGLMPLSGSKGSQSPDRVPKIPKQVAFKPGTPEHARVTALIESKTYLNDEVEAALHFVKYCDSKRSGKDRADSSTPDQPPRTPMYGFILRSVSEHETLDILIESDFLRWIRRTLYRRVIYGDNEGVNHQNRLLYNLMRAYLNEARNPDQVLVNQALMRALLSNFKDFFDKVDAFLANMQVETLSVLRKLKLENKMGPPKTPVTKLASALARRINKYEPTFSPFHSSAESVIRDYVCDGRQAILYLAAMGLA